MEVPCVARLHGWERVSTLHWQLWARAAIRRYGRFGSQLDHVELHEETRPKRGQKEVGWPCKKDIILLAEEESSFFYQLAFILDWKTLVETWNFKSSPLDKISRTAGHSKTPRNPRLLDCSFTPYCTPSCDFWILNKLISLHHNLVQRRLKSFFIAFKSQSNTCPCPLRRIFTSFAVILASTSIKIWIR